MKPLSPAAVAEARRSLIALRDSALRRLITDGHLDGGMLALLGSVSAAIAALDDIPTQATDTAERAIVGNFPLGIRLTLYRAADQVAAIDLSPLSAFAIARDLIAGALRRLECPLVPAPEPAGSGKTVRQSPKAPQSLRARLRAP